MKEPLTLLVTLDDKGSLKDNSKRLLLTTATELTPEQASRLQELFLCKEVGVALFETEVESKDLKH